MQLSISNIAWSAEQDDAVYELMHRYGFTGLEIAPTRILPEGPYNHLAEAAFWATQLKETHGFVVPSMQSIWYGRSEHLFGTQSDRQALTEYTKRAVDFAEAVGCRNLVFGCPRNRRIPEGRPEREVHAIALAFFREIGDYAAAHAAAIGMEANPPIYNTNYVNDTASALALIREVDSKGFLLNLDVGTMIACGESIDTLKGYAHCIHHVHISEPGLRPIEKRPLHRELAAFLQEADYQGFVSIEMATVSDLQVLTDAMQYVKEVF